MLDVGSGQVLSFNLGMVVDNLWVRPDGGIHPGPPLALDASTFLPGWMIRTEGWASVGRVGDELTVEFDARCIGTAAFGGLLDALGRMARCHLIGSVEVRHYNVDGQVRWRTASPVRACWYISRVREIAERFDDARYLAQQERRIQVHTEDIDLGYWQRVSRLPQDLAILDCWRSSRDFSRLIRCLDGASEHVSVFRLECGDPRVIRLGGAMLFGAPTAGGARLTDIVPVSQERASRARMLDAIRSGQPILRRHRSVEYDVLALTVPADHRGEIVAVTMSQPYQGRSLGGASAASVVTGRLPAPGPARLKPGPSIPAHHRVATSTAVVSGCATSWSGRHSR